MVQKFTKDISDFRGGVGGGNGEFGNQLCFESMFTKNVNFKRNMSTDMYYFTFFVTENRVYLGECPRYFATVIYKTNS